MENQQIKEKAEAYVKANQSKLKANLKEIRDILNGAVDIVVEAYNACDSEKDAKEANDILRYIKYNLYCDIIDKSGYSGDFLMVLDAPELTASKQVYSFNRRLEIIRENSFKKLIDSCQYKEKERLNIV